MLEIATITDIYISKFVSISIFLPELLFCFPVLSLVYNKISICQEDISFKHIKPAQFLSCFRPFTWYIVRQKIKKYMEKASYKAKHSITSFEVWNWDVLEIGVCIWILFEILHQTSVILWANRKVNINGKCAQCTWHS